MPEGAADLLLPILCEACGLDREWDDMLSGDPVELRDPPPTWRKSATPCRRCGCQSVIVTLHWISQVE